MESTAVTKGANENKTKKTKKEKEEDKKKKPSADKPNVNLFYKLIFNFAIFFTIFLIL